ncbi:protamine-like protein 99C [Drosophila yakuba]|uniref:HMG box domain-containing protein n=1 Tax=Drosophila yakuba TaxID=7245 RepID=B4P0W4_DROYA|nr:protamine-like protein 99C [Drosophila yakuba]EDW89038.1 uncharacterized protein Dyak_GE24787 [Drosophila yakuba]
MSSDKVNESQSMCNGSWAKSGFLNYMREFLQRNGDMGWIEFAEQGAKSWKNMSEEEKNHYRHMPDAQMGVISMSIEDEKPKALSEMCNHPMGRSMRKSMKSCAKPKKSCTKPRRKAACAKPRAACAKPRRSACPTKEKDKCSRSKCSRPGPVTNNGYLNFVRAFRKKHCDLKPQELIAQAAKAWSKLPEEKKDRYRRMACKVTTSERHKRRRICNPC